MLDAAAELFRGADAEFDDECFPEEPLGRLLAMARTTPATSKVRSRPGTAKSWYEGIERQFHDRYDFADPLPTQER